MLKKIATKLGLRDKTTMEKLKDADKKKLLLYTGLAFATIYGFRRALPFIQEMVKA